MSRRDVKVMILLLAVNAAVFADTTAVPASQATAPGNTPITLGSSAVRVQEVIGSDQFAGPITIIGLRLRSAPGTGRASSTSNLFKLTLSTTQAYSNTANSHSLPSTTFANNVGLDAKLVYNGPGSFSSPGCVTPGPCPFDVVVPFTTPFSYDPTKGRLLIDYTTGSATGVTGAIDGVTFPDSSNSSIAILSGEASSATAQALTAGGIVFGLDTPSATYYFPQLAIGGGWQTTLTYVDYSTQAVSCQTSFYSDTGTPLVVPFGGAGASTRGDTLPAGGTLHQQTTSSFSDPTVSGWATALCSSPIQASVLYRIFNAQNVAQGEAGVNASVTPATKFVTFAETVTGIAYANSSSSTTAIVTITGLNTAGISQGSKTITLGPNAHGAVNVGPFLGLNNFLGSVQITSTSPIVSLSLNAEAFPSFSSLPPGDLPASTVLASGH